MKSENTTPVEETTNVKVDEANVEANVEANAEPTPEVTAVAVIGSPTAFNMDAFLRKTKTAQVVELEGAIKASEALEGQEAVVIASLKFDVTEEAIQFMRRGSANSMEPCMVTAIAINAVEAPQRALAKESTDLNDMAGKKVKTVTVQVFGHKYDATNGYEVITDETGTPAVFQLVSAKLTRGEALVGPLKGKETHLVNFSYYYETLDSGKKAFRYQNLYYMSGLTDEARAFNAIQAQTLDEVIPNLIRKLMYRHDDGSELDATKATINNALPRTERSDTVASTNQGAPKAKDLPKAPNMNE